MTRINRLHPISLAIAVLHGPVTIYGRPPVMDREQAIALLRKVSGQDFGADPHQWAKWLRANGFRIGTSGDDRFFACTDCRIFVNAGGRCVRGLEAREVVRVGGAVDADRVLGEAGYWDDPAEIYPDWRREVLDPVRSFLTEHAEHGVVFFDEAKVRSIGDEEMLDWLQVGSEARWSPRHFAEVLALRQWAEVQEYVRQNERSVEADFFNYWLDDAERASFRAKFELLAER